MSAETVSDECGLDHAGALDDPPDQLDARLEPRIFFEELLDRFPVIELRGEPRRMRSNLNNALEALPVRLSA